MIDKDGYDAYLRQRFSLERALQDVGEFKSSTEVEFEMRFIEERLTDRIKQAHFHAVQEYGSLLHILFSALKDLNGGKEAGL